ncbi:hypothetical protein ACIGFK_39190 [Streptomyces sp. NPDC085524]|uniref:hypothetical protein n=1 Tax=Streptomyces sp. NPDC085524 TaxID=3365728 RepID=UPI0037D6DD76
MITDLTRKESERRVVRTRHGDAMLLADFMLTRVFEVAVHGSDLADALGREPLEPEESCKISRLGITWLALG